MLSKIREQTEAVHILQQVVVGRYISPLLLAGPSGIGKKFSVLEAAKEEFDSGLVGPHSIQISKGVHPDVVVLQSEDSKEIGVEEVRNLLALVSSYPATAPSRYVVVDDADRLTNAAANALLKVLEDPPLKTKFFLLSDSEGQVLPTIRSRCGTIRYKRLSETFIVQQLLQHIDDPTKALVYARLGEGSVGRAVQYLGSGRLALRDEMMSLLKVAVTGDISSLFSSINQCENLKLGLHFLDHLLHDLAMQPYAPDSLTNMDLAREIEGLRLRIGGKLDALIIGLRQLQLTARRSINLPAHFKSYLLTAFAE